MGHILRLPGWPLCPLDRQPHCAESSRVLQDQLLRIARDSEATELERCADVIGQACETQLSPIAALLDGQLVGESLFLRNLASELGLPWCEDPPAQVPDWVRERFPVRLAVRYCLLPQPDEGDTIRVLTADPFNLQARQAVAQEVSGKVNWGIAARSRIIRCLQETFGIGADTFEQIMAGGLAPVSDDDLRQETTVLDEDDTEASVARFVNQIIREALTQRATDIHIEPMEDDLRIRYRIDGVLHEVPVPSQIKLLRATLLSRVKIMAHLDIAERRLPQDGRINLELEGQPIDVRVATIPSVDGESISLRLLRQERFNFERLGLWPEDEAVIRDLISLPNGIILLTGPTGCGKSTSLYTFLSSLNTKDRRIVTIEDPVEYKLPGVIQIAVKPEINLTFAAGLRSILRGDPNVIMVGEMRDFETAETAIRAALTGHLVFSTLHTNDAVGGITRLIDMGVEPFLVSTSVRAFLAQRLVRVLCSHCKKPAHYSAEYLQKIGFPAGRADNLFEANGCERCRFTGFQGRTALFEICKVSDAVSELVAKNSPAAAIKAAALKQGMVPLRLAGFRRAAAGATTIEEVLRVTIQDSGGAVE